MSAKTKLLSKAIRILEEVKVNCFEASTNPVSIVEYFHLDDTIDILERMRKQNIQQEDKQ